MVTKLTFSEEVSNLLHASHGEPLKSCIQCGTCSGTCPVAEFMESNTFWYCASCFHCTVRCPSEIDIAGLMYALKRYSIWKHQYAEDAVGPVFSETFVKSILRSGRSYEPVLAPSYIFSYGVREFLNEAHTATNLMLKGRLPVLPARIKRLENFKKMANRIIPMGGA
jgi:quinone-modifying oxidoreductase subunit QmoC